MRDKPDIITVTHLEHYICSFSYTEHSWILNAERCRKILGFSNMDTSSVYPWNDNLYDSERWTNNEIGNIENNK